MLPIPMPKALFVELSITSVPFSKGKSIKSHYFLPSLLCQETTSFDRTIAIEFKNFFSKYLEATSIDFGFLKKKQQHSLSKSEKFCNFRNEINKYKELLLDPLFDGSLEKKEEMLNAIFLCHHISQEMYLDKNYALYNKNRLVEFAENCNESCSQNENGSKKPTAVFFVHDFLKTHQNNAVYNASAIESLCKRIKKISETHHVVVKQIKSSEDALKQLQEIKSNRKSCKITDVIFSMHGSPSSLYISEKDHGKDLNISSVVEDANIYLDACSTGKKCSFGISSYAAKLSKRHPKARVYAVDRTMYGIFCSQQKI